MFDIPGRILIMVLVGISGSRFDPPQALLFAHPRAAPHLTPAELEFTHELVAGGKLPMDIHRALVSKRADGV